jgi:two-component system, cell cycle sensor histidine kinase and response regulator CckA
MTLYLALIVAGALLAVAVVAVAQTRAARVALRACEETGGQSGQLPQNLERVGQLAGDIAHDLNDLLTAIIGHTELLIERLPRGDPMAPDAHEVRRAALSAARLTKQLLAVSRSQRTALEVIDVNEVAARTAGVLRGMLGEDIAVTLTLGADIKRIMAGASHVQEIVLNLALNARDAMPTGGRLTLTTTMHTRLEQDAAIGPAGQYVRLIVADTGCGIPEAVQSKVFEPFLTAQEAGGSAVGLAKVYSLVKENGGHIHLDSTAGVGSTFTVDLPALSELPAPLDLPPPAPRPVVGFAPILVVEDEPRVRELIKLVLVRAGYDIVAVAGPHDALAALNRQPDINLLLIDVVMPEMNGYDLASEARKIVPGAKVVFLSGFACDPTRQPATDGFLAKPFTVESLTGIVQLALAEI